jgi:hypothetical protein
LNEVVRILRAYCWDRQRKNASKLMTGDTEKGAKIIN